MGHCVSMTTTHCLLCRLSDGNNLTEPNNIVQPPEMCSLANYSQSIGNDTVKTWGWTDSNCGDKYPYMCRIASAWLCTNCPES